MNQNHATSYLGIFIGIAIMVLGLYLTTKPKVEKVPAQVIATTTATSTILAPFTITDTTVEEKRKNYDYKATLLNAENNETIQTIVTTYITRLDTEFEEYVVESDSSSVYSITHDYEIVRNDSDYFTFILNTYMYTGGAHGLPSFIIYTYDRQKNRLLTHEEVLGSQTQTMLRSALYGALLKKFGIQQQDSPLFGDEETYAAIDDVLTKTGSIGIGSTGSLYVRFPVYSVAPYAAGEITVEVER